MPYRCLLRARSWARIEEGRVKLRVLVRRVQGNLGTFTSGLKIAGNWAVRITSKYIPNSLGYTYDLPQSAPTPLPNTRSTFVRLGDTTVSLRELKYE
jgi:hypothetical protein